MDHRIITDIARTQHGLISRAQALDAGATRHTIQAQLRRGTWAPARDGIYIVGAAEATWRQRAMAACLAGGPDVQGSHRTGLRLHDVVDRSGRLEVLTDGYRRVRLPGVFVHRTIHLVPNDLTVIDGIPVTSLIRSLVDVGGRQSPRALGAMIDRAILAGQLDLGALAKRTNELTMSGRERPIALMQAIARTIAALAR